MYGDCGNKAQSGQAGGWGCSEAVWVPHTNAGLGWAGLGWAEQAAVFAYKYPPGNAQSPAQPGQWTVEGDITSTLTLTACIGHTSLGPASEGRGCWLFWRPDLAVSLEKILKAVQRMYLDLA